MGERQLATEDEARHGIAQGYRFDAFLSYSHAADGRLAPALRNGLHRFAKPLFEMRALRVFRDETSLSANPALWPSIEAALTESRFFILMSSPEAATSPWVSREVSWWCRHRTPETILIVMTDGDIVWDSPRRDFDWPRTSALPLQLKGVFADEPRWLDLRWARRETDVSLRNARFREAIADLAAPLHGRPKDEMIGEDVASQRRIARVRAGVIGVLTLLVIIATSAAIIAVNSAIEARKRRDEALVSQSKALALMSEQETNAGDTELAVLLALEALPKNISHPDRPYEPLAEVALARSLYRHRSQAVLLGHEDEVLDGMFSPDGTRIVTCSEDGTARLWDAVTGKELAILPSRGKSVISVAFSPAGAEIVTANGTCVGFNHGPGACHPHRP